MEGNMGGRCNAATGGAGGRKIIQVRSPALFYHRDPAPAGINGCLDGWMDVRTGVMGGWVGLFAFLPVTSRGRGKDCGCDARADCVADFSWAKRKAWKREMSFASCHDGCGMCLYDIGIVIVFAGGFLRRNACRDVEGDAGLNCDRGKA